LTSSRDQWPRAADELRMEPMLLPRVEVSVLLLPEVEVSLLLLPRVEVSGAPG